MKRTKQQKRYSNRIFAYLQDHRGITLERDALVEVLKVPDEMFDGPSMFLLRKRLETGGLALRVFPGRPHRTTHLRVIWTDGEENREDMAHEYHRAEVDVQYAQERQNRRAEISIKLFGYDPRQQLEGGKEDASNSSNSE